MLPCLSCEYRLDGPLLGPSEDVSPEGGTIVGRVQESGVGFNRRYVLPEGMSPSVALPRPSYTS